MKTLGQIAFEAFVEMNGTPAWASLRWQDLSEPRKRQWEHTATTVVRVAAERKRG